MKYYYSSGFKFFVRGRCMRHFGVQLVIGETDDKSFVNCTPI